MSFLSSIYFILIFSSGRGDWLGRHAFFSWSICLNLLACSQGVERILCFLQRDTVGWLSISKGYWIYFICNHVLLARCSKKLPADANALDSAENDCLLTMSINWVHRPFLLVSHNHFPLMHSLQQIETPNSLTAVHQNSAYKPFVRESSKNTLQLTWSVILICRSQSLDFFVCCTQVLQSCHRSL